MKFILDTDILSLIHAGDDKVGQRKDRVDLSDIAITIVSKIEILRARYAFLLNASDGEQLLRAQQWLARSEELLGQFRVIAFDESAAAVFDRLRSNAKRRKIGRADLLIASIALAQGNVLVTRNLKHFRQVPRLELENWAD